MSTVLKYLAKKARLMASYGQYYDEIPGVNQDADLEQASFEIIFPIDDVEEKESNIETEEAEATEETGAEDVTLCHQFWLDVLAFYNANSFPVKAVLAILLASAYPRLGAEYVHPQITATWIAVLFIFLMSGLGLKTEEFTQAFSRVWFNLFVQGFNFFTVSLITFGITRLLISSGAIAKSLGNGMTICACLPMTINMMTVLTVSSGGDEASSVFNAAFGNGIGVFLSPLLIFGYLGVQGNLEVGQVFVKLMLRVLMPVFLGQILQKFVKTVVDFVKEYKPHFKSTQEWCLVFIIYTVFCKTFRKGDVPQLGQVLLMIVLQCVIFAGVMVLAWISLTILFKNDPKLRVTGLFACTHKTMAMGVPLIHAIYEHDPSVGLYTLPLLVWYPTQLLVGSFLTPRLVVFVKNEEERVKREQDYLEEISLPYIRSHSICIGSF